MNDENQGYVIANLKKPKEKKQFKPFIIGLILTLAGSEASTHALLSNSISELEHMSIAGLSGIAYAIGYIVNQVSRRGIN